MRAITDTDRLNALFTLFGGPWAFDPFWKIQDTMKGGRAGLDKFIEENPSLIETPERNVVYPKNRTT